MSVETLTQKAILKIHLIEDNEEDAYLIHEALRHLDASAGSTFVMSHSKDLAKGLARVEKGDIDVVLLDLSLPDSRGLESLRQVRSQNPTVPIVVLSGHSDESLALEALRNGAQDYLIKGQVGFKMLYLVIRYAVERKRVERQVAEMENFAVVASHDLQEPLQKIRLFGELLLENGSTLDAKSRDYVERIQRNTEKMSEMINNLLDYVKSKGKSR